MPAVSESARSSRPRCPDFWWRVPGWLIDPLGPLSLRFGHLPSLLPWLWRFLKSGTQSEMLRVTAALASLAEPTYDDLLPLLERIGLSRELHHAGALSVYETSEGFARDRAEWDLKRKFGIVAEEISGAEAREREPALGPIVKHAISTPGWAHVDDPKRIVDFLRAYVAGRGAVIDIGEAVGIETSAVRTADGRRLQFDALVVAAGVWSGRLARTLGDRALIESERGYNTTLPNSNVALNAEVIFSERKFVATPLAIGLRIGGAAEFAGLDAPPNYARSRALVALASRYFPGSTREAAANGWGIARRRPIPCRSSVRRRAAVTSSTPSGMRIRG